ncbi:MAG: hypothetical protein KC613_16385 [Myxococcales bacterium]|nr:hypothetical protein [Myxococcales bacterium]MCB9522597.1 hypothetical protein [Myxococcales bacterium]
MPPRPLGPPPPPPLLRITPEPEPTVQLLGMPPFRPGLPRHAGRPRRWFGRALNVVRDPQR